MLKLFFKSFLNHWLASDYLYLYTLQVSERRENVVKPPAIECFCFLSCSSSWNTLMYASRQQCHHCLYHCPLTVACSAASTSSSVFLQFHCHSLHYFFFSLLHLLPLPLFTLYQAEPFFVRFSLKTHTLPWLPSLANRKQTLLWDCRLEKLHLSIRVHMRLSNERTLFQVKHRLKQEFVLPYSDLS